MPGLLMSYWGEKVAEEINCNVENGVESYEKED